MHILSGKASPPVLSKINGPWLYNRIRLRVWARSQVVERSRVWELHDYAFELCLLLFGCSIRLQVLIRRMHNIRVWVTNIAQDTYSETRQAMLQGGMEPKHILFFQTQKQRPFYGGNVVCGHLRVLLGMGQYSKLVLRFWNKPYAILLLKSSHEGDVLSQDEHVLIGLSKLDCSILLCLKPFAKVGKNLIMFPKELTLH